MKCKVCKKDLLVELDFRSLFLWNYTIHESCKKILKLEMKHHVIPIQNNTVLWLYFLERNIELNSNYVEFYLIGKGLEYCIYNTGWSIVNWTTQDEYYELDDLTQYLYLKLGDQSFVFLSLFQNM